ncbi:MAG: NnrS family protein [Candidatus Sericytochromatia bacterium]
MNNNKKYLAIWGLSFRPFFLFGAISSIVLMFIWLGFQRSWFNLVGYYNPVIWHAHEMIYGFSASIIIGFLFTASANWVGKQGINNKKLQILFFTWVLGRMVPFIFKTPNLFASLIDLSFFPLAIYYLYPYLGIKEQKRNQVFFILFGLLFTGNSLIHLETLGLLNDVSRKGLMLGLSTIIMIITVIGGRVFPFFKQKAVENSTVKTIPVIEKLVFFSTFIFILTNTFFEMSYINSIICIFTGLLHLIRFYFWNPIQTRKVPILWILFIGYFWMTLAFILKGVSIFYEIPVSPSSHLFTIGSIGILIYGMITRVSLGHTGRIIKADKTIILSYILLNLATILRVFIPLISIERYSLAILDSSLLWIIAFSLFVFKYSRILISPRPDGKEG